MRLPWFLRIRGVLTFGILCASLGIPTPARASDGVLEINQACAEVAGCFAGDGPGFPIQITAPGSYRLTSSLKLPDVNTTGIVITAPDVSLDLGGFSIRGEVVCTGTPLVCSPSVGLGAGIFTDARASLLRISNGSISGMGADGMDLRGLGCSVSEVQLGSNRLNGLTANSTFGCMVKNVTALGNGRSGILAGQQSVASGNTASFNGDSGISVGLGSTTTGNSASFNLNLGISGGSNVTMTGNTAVGNAGDGISVALGSTVSGNTSALNGGDGIQTGAGTLLIGNSVRDNTGAGLRLGDDSAYRENLITSNFEGTVVVVSGTIFNQASNSCTDDSNATVICP